jgi:putative FmdB family regulatory protein
MPLYEYECAKCNKIHDVVQKFSDAPLSACPECSGPVTKLISRSSFSLKGSGWYTTDYKRGGEKKSEASPESAATPAAATAPSTAAAAAPVTAPPAKAEIKSS